MTWFAYNSGVAANGVRDRISPELTYFYRSLGFASQYYQQDQYASRRRLRSRPIVDVSYRRLLRHG